MDSGYTFSLRYYPKITSELERSLEIVETERVPLFLKQCAFFQAPYPCSKKSLGKCTSHNFLITVGNDATINASKGMPLRTRCVYRRIIFGLNQVQRRHRHCFVFCQLSDGQTDRTSLFESSSVNDGYVISVSRSEKMIDAHNVYTY